MLNPDDANEHRRGLLDHLSTQSIALRLIAALGLALVASLLGTILVPFFLAMVVALAMAPAAAWLDRKGLPKALSALLCMLAVAAALTLTLGLVIYQAGTVLQDSDKYLRGVSEALARISRQTGGDEIMESLGVFKATAQEAERGDRAEPDALSGRGAEADLRDEPGAPDPARTEVRPPSETGEPGASADYWERLLRSSLESAGAWFAAGLGGLIGFFAGIVLFLAFLFYMLKTRDDWGGRLKDAMASLGMRPRHRDIAHSQHEIRVFVTFVGIVSLTYAILTSIAFWLIGLPNPVLWGVLTGLLEFVPFIGPIISGTLVTLVALTLGSLWQPLTVLGIYIALNLVEGYVITPMVYGSAVKIDPVTVLFGILLFAIMWGPIGSILALPLMILLRGLIVMTPDTPALDAIADVEDRKQESEARDGLAPAPSADRT